MRLAPLGFHIFQVYLLLVLVLWVKSMLVNPYLQYLQTFSIFQSLFIGSALALAMS